MRKNKIGIGIITCNRPDYFNQCIKSIDKNLVDTIVIVNDGKDLDQSSKKNIENANAFYILNEKNLGVSKTKNKALKYLLDQNCEHIFILEEEKLEDTGN